MEKLLSRKEARKKEVVQTCAAHYGLSVNACINAATDEKIEYNNSADN